MSRKNIRRSVKKQKRILRRKNQKQRKIMAHLGKPKKTTSDINNVLSGDHNQHQQQQDVVNETNSETSVCYFHFLSKDFNCVFWLFIC